MASLVCIPKNVAMALKTRLKSGEITPAKLAEMTSDQRHKYFAKFLDEDYATSVNALYEAKTLLKDQQRGLITWLETVAGLKPEVKRSLIDRVQRMNKFLDPKEKEDFLADLAAQKLGVGVTMDEAKTITRLSNDYQTKLTALNRSLKDGHPARVDVGAAQVKFENYVAELKREANKRTLEEFRAQPLRSFAGQFSDIGGLAKSIKASMDNSFIFRQGFKAIFAHPKEWAKNAAGSWDLIVRQLGKKGTDNDVINAIKAEIYGRENALNGSYRKMGLDLGTVEEAFPTSLPEKIWMLGRVYKASETAFNGTAYRLRADIADQLLISAKKAGRDITEKELLKSIGTYTNSLTGRGDLGRAEGFAKAFNNLFFSPRFFKSNLDFLTAHMFDKNMDPMLKRKAAVNLARVIAGVGAGLALAKAINPDSVNFDPTSSDFGKIKVGNTRVDVTAGMASFVTLAARVADVLARGATQGEVKLGGKKSYNRLNPVGSLLGTFLANKASPTTAVVMDIGEGKNFDGKPMNLNSTEGIANVAAGLFAPIPVTNTLELANDPESIGPILGTMLDGIGFGTSNYK